VAASAAWKFSDTEWFGNLRYDFVNDPFTILKLKGVVDSNRRKQSNSGRGDCVGFLLPAGFTGRVRLWFAVV
jgi:hypothetical protein